MIKSPIVLVTGFNTKMHGSFLEGKGTVKCGSPCTTSTDTVAAGGGVEVAGILLLEDTKEPANNVRMYFGNQFWRLMKNLTS